MNRRDFIVSSSTAAMFSVLDAHALLDRRIHHNVLVGSQKSRITALELLTVTPIQSLRNFYVKSMGLSVLSETKERITIQAGETKLTFVYTPDIAVSPFYHVAFNIPENKIVAAYEWQKKNTKILPTPSHMIDPNYPDDIRHFRGWNAHSIFFWDPAGNLLEYIARHDLKNPSLGSFSGNDILYASEIAFIVDDVDLIADQFRTSLGYEEYKEGNEHFRAMGDEHGLMLIMRKGRVWMGNTNSPKTPGVYNTRVVARSAKKTILKFHDYPYEINGI